MATKIKTYGGAKITVESDIDSWDYEVTVRIKDKDAGVDYTLCLMDTEIADLAVALIKEGFSG